MTNRPAAAAVDLTSKPLTPWSMQDKERMQMRIALAKAADGFRREGKYVKAEKAFKDAARYTDTGSVAVEHLLRSAAHCRELHELKKAGKI